MAVLLTFLSSSQADSVIADVKALCKQSDPVSRATLHGVLCLYQSIC